MLKKFTGIILTAGLVCSSVPALVTPPAIYAASDARVTIENTSSRDDNMKVRFENIPTRATYKIIVDGDVEQTEDCPSGDNTIFFSKRTLNINRDATVTIEIYDRHNDLIATTSNGEGPTFLKIETTRLNRDEDNQLVEISFNRGYVPERGDRLVFYGLDQDDRRLGSSYNITKSIDRDDVYNFKDDKRYNTKIDIPRQVYGYEVVFESDRDTSRLVRDRIFFDGNRHNNNNYNNYNNNYNNNNYNSNSRSNRYIEIERPDENVGLGDRVTLRVNEVDRDGYRHDITDKAKYEFTGDGIDRRYSDGFTIENNTRYLDKRITIRAEYDGLYTYKDVYINRDGDRNNNNSSSSNKTYDKDTVVLDKTDFKVDENNSVDFTLKDRNGKTVTVPFRPTQCVLNLSDPDNSTAKVEMSVDNFKNLYNKGEGTLQIKSNKNVKGNLLMVFLDDRGNAFTLTSDKAVKFTGEVKKPVEKPTIQGPALKNKSVTMYINSPRVDTSSGSITIDSAPIIQSNRTFVPIRALAESFGAKVDWDPNNNKITMTLLDKQVVMTVGQPLYTVNGDNKIMDVSPFINPVNSRTLVPVRFAAESLGFNLKPIYGANGGTYSVQFTAK